MTLLSISLTRYRSAGQLFRAWISFFGSHNVLQKDLKQRGVLFSSHQHLADLLCVDGQLVGPMFYERHDHDDDKVPKSNFILTRFAFCAAGRFPETRHLHFSACRERFFALFFVRFRGVRRSLRLTPYRIGEGFIHEQYMNFS